MSVAQQTFQSPTQNQSSVQNNLQKPKLLLRTYRIEYDKNKALNAFSPLGCSLSDCFQVFIASFINLCTEG